METEQPHGDMDSALILWRLRVIYLAPNVCYERWLPLSVVMQDRGTMMLSDPSGALCTM